MYPQSSTDSSGRLAPTYFLVARPQWILGHAHLTTTQIYVSTPLDEAIASILAHHARRSKASSQPASQVSDYRAESLNVLFGTSRG